MKSPLYEAGSVLPDCSRATLQGIIRGRVDVSSVINSDGWRGYNGLVDLGYGHLRIDHGNDEFANGSVHINGIEGFWSFAKHILYNYRGVSKYHFPMYLKEVEYRFNHRNQNLFKLLLSIYFGYEYH